MSQDITYRNNGELQCTFGGASVYSLDATLYLESSAGQLVSSDNDIESYIWQLGSKPKGKVLILGLGLGLCAHYVLSLPAVDSIDIVEPNRDIIACHDYVMDYQKYSLYHIFNQEYLNYLYTTTKKYDFIFIDCYTAIDNTTMPIIADLVIAANTCLTPNGTIKGRLIDNTPEFFIDLFYGLFN